MDRCFCKVSGSRAYSKAAVVGICHSCGDHRVFVWQLVYSTDSAVQACRVQRSAGANAIGRIPGVSPAQELGFGLDTQISTASQFHSCSSTSLIGHLEPDYAVTPKPQKPPPAHSGYNRTAQGACYNNH